MLYEPVVLLDNIIQIFILTTLDYSPVGLVVIIDSSYICATFIDIDLLWFTIILDGFIQKSFGCFLVSLSRKQVVNRVTFFVYSSI